MFLHLFVFHLDFYGFIDVDICICTLVILRINLGLPTPNWQIDNSYVDKKTMKVCVSLVLVISISALDFLGNSESDMALLYGWMIIWLFVVKVLCQNKTKNMSFILGRYVVYNLRHRKAFTTCLHFMPIYHLEFRLALNFCNICPPPNWEAVY